MCNPDATNFHKSFADNHAQGTKQANNKKIAKPDVIAFCSEYSKASNYSQETYTQSIIPIPGIMTEVVTKNVSTCTGHKPNQGIPSDANTPVAGVWMLQPGEAEIVARRLRAALTQKA